MLAKLFPIRMVMRNLSGFLAKSFAILAVKDERDFISSFILFAVMKAISLAEKKADKISKMEARIISVCIVGKFYFK